MSLAQIRRAARSARRRLTVDYGPAPQPLGTPVDLTGLATYYVDPVGGSNGNNGTSAATPKQTLAGLPTLVAGNIVALKAGTTIREAMPMTGSGSSGSPIVWGRYGAGARPKIKGSKDYGTALTWSLNSGAIYQATASAMPSGHANVYVDETTPLRRYTSLANLQAGTAGGYFADVAGNTLHVWMHDGSNPTGHNIEVNGLITLLANASTQAYVEVQDIAIMHGSGGNSGFFSASTNAGIAVRRCQIGPHSGAGIYAGSPGMIVEDCYITTCWDGYEYPGLAVAGYGIQTGGANTAGAQIRRNWVTNCRNGIFINGATGGVDIHHNFVYLNRVNGIDNFAAAGTRNVRVVNNTIWHRPTGPTPAGHGLDQQSGGDGLYAVNNVVFTDFTSAGASNVEAFTLASGTGANTLEDYNLGWVDPASTGVFGKVGTTTYPTSAGYWDATRTAYGAGNNTHSLDADPRFVSLGDLDPRLRDGSPAINVGVVVAGITDGYVGSAPDLGAFESASLVDPPPPPPATYPSGTVTTLHRWKADSIGQADASAVTSWAALAGGVALTQGTAAAQPTYRTAVLNGKPVVRFDGTSDFLTATGLGTDVQPYTLYVVLKSNVATGLTEPLHWGAEALLNTNVRQFNGKQFGTYTAGTWEVWTMVGNGASTITAVNGTTIAGSGTPTAVDMATDLVLGAHTGGTSRWFNGDIAELIHCDGAHDATQRAAMHAYLRDEYAIPMP